MKECKQLMFPILAHFAAFRLSGNKLGICRKKQFHGNPVKLRCLIEQLCIGTALPVFVKCVKGAIDSQKFGKLSLAEIPADSKPSQISGQPDLCFQFH